MLPDMTTPSSTKLAGLYSLDVEADGPCPGLFSMLSFALVPLDDPSRAFYTTLAPITDRFEPGALAVNGWSREETLGFTPADQAMAALAAWLEAEPSKGRKIVWSDNPAFDWQFLNYYCHAYLGTNPFGHSARRIADYAAGLTGNPRNTADWKKFRTEKHTHHALEDARGNAGALVHLLSLEGQPHLPEAKVSVYRLGNPNEPSRQATLESVHQRHGPTRWAVRGNGGMCLNKQGMWEQEPFPSARDDAFFERCRWETVVQAYKAWKKARE